MKKIELTGVPETMLQTLYARADYSRKHPEKFFDQTSINLVEQLDYDFSNAGKDAVMSNGVLARTFLLDKIAGDFLKKNPDAVVVNIACGLDTRCYRVGTDAMHWYNLDLPETIAVRKQLLDETGHISMIAKSATDETWAEDVKETSGEVLVLVEGLIMYLSEKDTRQILSIIDHTFEHATVVVEAMSPFVVKHIEEKSIKNSGAKFTYGIKSGKELAALCPTFRPFEDISLAKGMEILTPSYKLISWIPAIRNISNKLLVIKK